ncbi:MAG: hypothetical protein H6557_22125 [Lewinellaceae bacterium]|nr:hypothetical protein [Phaeodactylibacter sp.]MCB9039321.1 hypothetical protein [Lewinellaceae bacterium]
MKNKMSFLKSFLLSSLLLMGASAILSAQPGESLLAQLAEEEKDAVNALAMYPEDTRLAILESSKYPEALIKMQRIQTQTSTSFQGLLQAYPQSTQEMIWDVTRYPGLVERLVSEGRGSQANIRGILRDYPEAVEENALSSGMQYLPLLEEINQVQRSADEAFNTLLRDYPPDVQNALNTLLGLPEVLTILTDNIELTLLVGDLYRRDPALVLHKADSLSLEVARQNAQELEDWKAELESNPEAAKELEASAEEFAAEYGYDDDYYDYPDDDVYYDEPGRTYVVENHYYYNYPYWFGYPYWYAYPRWRPYPYWYDWGFYYRPGRTLVILHLPSYYFTNWYFYHPNHHYRYPHLSAHFVRHYQHHPRSGGSITTSVTGWRNNNREVITRNWIEDDNRLVERFREYGRFESERETYNRNNPTRALSQQEYLEKNANRYTELEKRVKQDREIYQEPAYAPRDKAPVREPEIRQPNIPKQEPRVEPKAPEPARQPRTKAEPRETVKQPNTRVEPKERVEPAPPPRQEPQKREQATTPERKPTPKTEPPQTREIPKVEQGRDYHKNRWEEPKPAPQPRTAPPPAQRREVTKPEPAPQKREATRPQPAPQKREVAKPKTGTKKEGGN